VYILVIRGDFGLLQESDTTLSADGTTQLLATNSSNRVISSVAREVDKRGGWAKTSGEVVTTDVASLGLYWFQHLNLTDQYGLRWHVVVAEVASQRPFNVYLAIKRQLPNTYRMYCVFLNRCNVTAAILCL
jgi:hypothetical protein